MILCRKYTGWRQNDFNVYASSGKGFVSGVAGQEGVKGTPGPMAADVDGLA